MTVADAWPETPAPAVTATGTYPISDGTRVVVDTPMLVLEAVPDSTQTADVLPEIAQPTSMVLLLLAGVSKSWRYRVIQSWCAD